MFYRKNTVRNRKFPKKSVIFPIMQQLAALNANEQTKCGGAV